MALLLARTVNFYFSLRQPLFYSEIMQSMTIATKYLNTPTWHRQRADKLSAAAARRSSKIRGAHKLTAARQTQGFILFMSRRQDDISGL